MASPRLSLLHALLAIATLTAALPTSSPTSTANVHFNTPSTCIRELAAYDFSQCTRDLDDLIRQARQSIKGIEIIGMRLVDVIGPAAKILPDRLPVTHTCFPRRIREQEPNGVPGWQYNDDRFVPFRLNLECDDQDIITAFSWH